MACAADAWAHGSWQRVGSNATPCGAYAYVNETCLAPLSLDRLCTALGDRSALFVGDSLMLSVFSALVGKGEGAAALGIRPLTERWHHCTDENNSSKCYPRCCHTVTLPCQRSRRGKNARLTFARHNHLLGRFRELNDTSGRLSYRVLDESWSAERTLSQYQLLVLSTGAHVLEVPGHTASTTFVRRAAELGTFLAQRHPHNNIWLSPSWGRLDAHSGAGTPGAAAPPSSNWR